MKFRWHIQFILFASLCALFVGRWLLEPIWQVVDERHVQFDKYHAELEEWSVIVGDPAKKQWWQETRSRRNPAVVTRLQLALPPMHEFSRPYLGSHLTSRSNPCDPIICTDINNPNPNDARLYIGGRTYVLDAHTGKLLRQFTTVGRFNCSTASHGRIAFFEAESICLFDAQTGVERKIVLQPFLKVRAIEFSPTGKMLGVVFSNNTFWLIDWSQGKLINAFPEGKEVHACSFLSEDIIRVTTSVTYPDSVHTRYQWDGRKLQQISPGFTLNRYVVPYVAHLNKDKTFHFLSNFSNDWPTSLRSIFQWLTKWNLPIERWYPKKQLEHWVVLDEQDQILDKYDKPYSTRHPLSEHLSVEIDNKPGKPGATIRLWNLAPIWPNAVAAGLVVYLLLYVAGRCWGSARLHAWGNCAG